MVSKKQDFFSIWRINTRTQEFKRESIPQSWEHLGGRGLIARILLDEDAATCDPLGPNNKLIFAPGLLVGHILSSTDRISIGAKSPLTGGIKESNAGGRTGLQLSRLGIKALIIDDHPKEPGYWILYLNSEGARFEKADEFSGLGVFEVTPRLLERYGEKVAIALIGQGGEMRMASAGIQNLDRDNSPTRIAARGGLGAVMATKGIKAIVIDDSSGEKPPIKNIKAFQTAQKEFTKALLAHPQTNTYKEYGTAAMTLMCNSFGALPSYSFSRGQFPGAENISGEKMREMIINRNGECETSHACMRGCAIQCSNVFGNINGKAIVSPLEYETIGLMGSNLGIDDLDIIARMNQQVNDLGLDTIEIGAALGVAAEARLMEYGDGECALELIHEIRQGTPLGRILGGGAAITGKVYGIERVPVAKGMAMSSYDPRSIKGTGVTYASSPQGADHTCGLTIRANVDQLVPEGQVEVSRTAQINMAGIDTLGACLMAGFGYGAVPHTISELLNARYGWDVGEDILQILGRETLKLEREFNKLAGFTNADDRLPEWMTRESLPPMNSVFDVPDEEIDNLFNW